jgi:hypothetical protein
VSLEGRTLTVRVDMIKGVPAGDGFTLETSGPKMINSPPGACERKRRHQGSLANDRLLRILELRYGGKH